MLVLTRRYREIIRIQVPGCEDVLIRMEDIQSGKARLSIDAPPEIRIWREEVYQDRKEEGVPQ